MENSFPFKRILAIRGANKQLVVNPADCSHHHLSPGFQRIQAGSNFVIVKVQICSDCHLVDPFHHGPIVPNKERR